MKPNRSTVFETTGQAGHPRQGWTLVELLAVIGMTSILGTICLRVLILMMQSHSAFGVRTARELTLQQLEDRLRQDASVATSVEVDEQGESHRLLLQTANDPVEYLLKSGQIQRRVPGDDQSRENSLFSLPEFLPEVRSDSGFIVLTLSHQSGKSPPQEVTAIEVRVGQQATPTPEGQP